MKAINEKRFIEEKALQSLLATTHSPTQTTVSSGQARQGIDFSYYRRRSSSVSPQRQIRKVSVRRKMSNVSRRPNKT